MRTVKWVLIGALAVSGIACTDENAARETLRAAGYSQIEITGYDWFACGEGDGTCTGFRAKGPTGVPVHGAVGCGFWSWQKGCTLRVTAQ